MLEELYIFGNGQIADLASYYFKKQNRYKIFGFILDDNFVKENSFSNLPILSLTEFENKKKERIAKFILRFHIKT